MRVDLHAKVRTRDGQDAGTVQRAVVDPRSNEVTEFVVNTGALLGAQVVVPRAELEHATADGEWLRLRLTKAELEELPVFTPASYVAPPAGWVMPVGYGFAYADYLWPAGSVSGGYAESLPATGKSDAVSLEKGSLVLDRRGDDLGVVDEVLFDAETGRLRAFVLRIGGVFQTLFGGGDSVEIAVGQVARVDEGRVLLRVEKEDLRPAARE